MLRNSIVYDTKTIRVEIYYGNISTVEAKEKAVTLICNNKLKPRYN
jgi:hypothetical protein